MSAAHFSLLTQERIPDLNQGAFCLPLPAPVGVARYTRLALGGAGTVVEIQPDAMVMNDLDTHGKDLVLPASAWRPAGARAFLRSTVTGTRVIKSSNKLSGGAKAGWVAAVVGVAVIVGIATWLNNPNL